MNGYRRFGRQRFDSNGSRRCLRLDAAARTNAGQKVASGRDVPFRVGAAAAEPLRYGAAIVIRSSDETTPTITPAAIVGETETATIFCCGGFLPNFYLWISA